MKTRIVQTRFWDDSFVYGLNPNAKLLFLYCLTNKRIELTGAYELPLPFISVETLLTKSEIEESLQELYPKVAYIDGFIVVRNATKYQNYNKGNSYQKDAFSKEYENLPLSVKTFMEGDSMTSPMTSHELVVQLDRNKKTEIRNKKTEMRKSAPVFSKNYFKEHSAEILEQVKVEYADNPVYEGKDFDRVMQEFLEGIEIKDYKYKNYRLAYLKWLRNSYHKDNQRLIGTKTKLAIN